MDRTALSVGWLHDESDEKAYWLSKTFEERLAAMELMRQIVYGYEYATAPRLQRVFAIDGVPVNLITLCYLKINKQASGRPKDLNDLEHLP